MLTRLKVSGFKNLVDVDIRFGPFTCIAGANGTGKSNLFDAIRFLSALAEHDFATAARLIRDEDGQTSDARSLFHRVGIDMLQEMSFEAEMIVPGEDFDAFNQLAKATTTRLRYKLRLRYRGPQTGQSEIEMLEEDLRPIAIQDTEEMIPFPTSKEWRRSVLDGKRRNNVPYVSTDTDEQGNRIIKLHQDGGSRGRPLSFLASSLPRSVLTATNAVESPTAVVARREMESWRQLQLEPSALRKPDSFSTSPGLAPNGAHLARTLYELAERSNDDPARVYATVANRLAELIDDVRGIRVDRDERRELYTLYVTMKDGTEHPARSLSDGTLRFIALTVLEIDSRTRGVICLEEPENGIHPQRIPAMIELLQDIAMGTDFEVGDDNPFRQVIINTHSPAIVQQVPEDAILIANLLPRDRNGKTYKIADFACLPDEDGSSVHPNWRLTVADPPRTIPRGVLLSYLGIASPKREYNGDSNGILRVIDRRDVQDLYQLVLPFGG
jgi:predicted ATPase